MLFLNLRLIGQPRPESLVKRYLPPSPKPKGEPEPKNTEHLRRAKTIEKTRNTHQVYYLERRLFM